MQPMSGKIYTYFKTKWTFLIYFGVFELGSLICGVAQSSVMLIIGRAIAGLGAAGLQNGTLTILAGLAPLARRACKSSDQYHIVRVVGYLLTYCLSSLDWYHPWW